MTIPYALRLISVCLASFAILFVIAGCAVSLVVPAALRAAERMRSDLAARFTLVLRLAPAAFAALTVITICIPSFVRFEQREEQEDVGAVCLALALLTLALFAMSLVRTVRAWRRSSQGTALLALRGLVRHRIEVSDVARNVLTDAQLAMAIRHEDAHARSGDNLKRLFILIAPGAFPRMKQLEQAWKRFAEWSADDRAAAGDTDRAVTLAEALVRVAKLGTGDEPALVTSFLAGENQLEARVERLLNPCVTTQQPSGAMRAAVAMTGVLMAIAVENPAAVHKLLERLVH